MITKRSFFRFSSALTLTCLFSIPTFAVDPSTITTPETFHQTTIQPITQKKPTQNVTSESLFIDQTAIVHLPPSANTVYAEPRNYSEKGFDHEIKGHYSNNFWIYGSLFLLGAIADLAR